MAVDFQTMFMAVLGSSEVPWPPLGVPLGHVLEVWTS